jgi:hypothetical protein
LCLNHQAATQGKREDIQLHIQALVVMPILASRLTS